MNSHEVFIHIHQGCFAGTGAIVRLPQCQWSKPDGYGKISQCITTTKHSKAKTECIFLGIYCMKQHFCWNIFFAQQNLNFQAFTPPSKVILLEGQPDCRLIPVVHISITWIAHVILQNNKYEKIWISSVIFNWAFEQPESGNPVVPRQFPVAKVNGLLELSRHDCVHIY